MKRIVLTSDTVTSKGRMLVSSVVKLPDKEAAALVAAKVARWYGEETEGDKLKRIMTPNKPTAKRVTHEEPAAEEPATKKKTGKK